MSDVHAAIVAALDHLHTLAKRAHDAEPGAWHARHFGLPGSPWDIVDARGDELAHVGHENDARLIAAVASPDVVLRQVEADRELLAEHRPSKALSVWHHGQSGPACMHGHDDEEDIYDAVPWRDCREVRRLARRLGVNIEETNDVPA